jgi:type I restriction enzyme, S subunit
VTLPTGWVETTLGEIADFNPKHPPTFDRNLPISFVPMPAVDEHTGTITAPLTRVLSEVWTGFTHFADQDVIFAKITPCMENGKAAVAAGLLNGIACGSTEFHVMRSTGAVEPSLLWRYLRQRSFRELAAREMTGAVGQRRVPKSYLENRTFFLPPLAEQRRIVAKLDTLTARLARARTELDRVTAMAGRARSSTLAKVFAFGSVPTISLGRVLEDVQAGKSLKCDERQPSEIELGVVKVSAVSSEVFKPSEAKTLPVGYRPPEGHRIRSGDLLLARASGSINLVGRVALVEADPKNLYLSDKVLRLVLNDQLAPWIYWFLRSPQGRTQMVDAASGISMHNVTQSSLATLLVPLPDERNRNRGLSMLKTAFARADRLEAEAARARALLDPHAAPKAKRGRRAKVAA